MMADTGQIGRRYDTVADRYDDIFFYVAEGGRRLVDYADPVPGARMLDVGAGRGAVVRAGLGRGCRIAAVDASSRMVERLSEEFPDIDVRRMNAGRLEFADDSFDLVTAGFVMEVLDDPARAVAEFRRVLVPGGVLALSLERPTVGGLPWLRDLHADFFPVAPPHESTADSPALSADRLDRLLTEAGLIALSRTTVTFTKRMADPQALWQWLAIQGLTEAVATLPEERAEEFRARFFVAARHMQAHGGIVPEFLATLHRARVPG